MKAREEIKQEMGQTEKYLAELMEERKYLIKNYSDYDKHRGNYLESVQQWNELVPKIHNAQNKLNHLTQLYFGAKE